MAFLHEDFQDQPIFLTLAVPGLLILPHQERGADTGNEQIKQS